MIECGKMLFGPLGRTPEVVIPQFDHYVKLASKSDAAPLGLAVHEGELSLYWDISLGFIMLQVK